MDYRTPRRPDTVPSLPSSLPHFMSKPFRSFCVGTRRSVAEASERWTVLDSRSCFRDFAPVDPWNESDSDDSGIKTRKRFRLFILPENILLPKPEIPLSDDESIRLIRKRLKMSPPNLLSLPSMSWINIIYHQIIYILIKYITQYNYRNYSRKDVINDKQI